MKGVSAVIAVILILMIVVALAALAYTWFTGIFSSLTETAGSSIEGTTESMSKQFSLDSVTCNSAGTNVQIAIRNTGDGSLNASQVALYYNGVPYANQTPNGGMIGEGAIGYFQFSPSGGCASDQIVRVSIENGVSLSASVA